jgi:hypothetical protein
MEMFISIKLDLLQKVFDKFKELTTTRLLGNSGKTCPPQNVEFDEIHEMSFQGSWFWEDLESWTREALKSRTCETLESWTCEALKSRTCETLESWTCESLKSRTCKTLESWTCEALKSWTCETLESRTWEVLKSKVREDTESWTCETPESRIYEVRESTEVQIRESWRVKISMSERLVNQQEANSKMLPRKFGFDVWTSGRLINVWDVKDVHVCVHIGNIP